MLKCNITEKKTNVVQNNSDNYYINETFVKRALNFPLTLKEVQNQFDNLSISKKTTKNPHDPKKRYYY
jgi:hypothetical protein